MPAIIGWQRQIITIPTINQFNQVGFRTAKDTVHPRGHPHDMFPLV